MIYFILFISLAALIIGADLLVRGAVNLASAFGVPTLIIGLTIVAWGTSAPELVVSLTAGLKGEYGIALGNIVGSNIANILLIAGVAAVLMPLVTKIRGIRFNGLLLFVVTSILTAMVLYGQLDPWIGLGLVLIEILILYRAFMASEVPDMPKDSDFGAVISAILSLLGIILVGGGGFFLVDAAEHLAYLWGVPPAIVGLSVVAIGTSLPELAATIAAAYRRQGDLILGNIIGSNLANILIVFGITSLFAPGHIPDAHQFTPVLGLMMVATAGLLGFVLLQKGISRLTGGILVCVYFAFLVTSYFFDGPHV